MINTTQNTMTADLGPIIGAEKELKKIFKLRT